MRSVPILDLKRKRSVDDEIEKKWVEERAARHVRPRKGEEFAFWERPEVISTLRTRGYMLHPSTEAQESEIDDSEDFKEKSAPQEASPVSSSPDLHFCLQQGRDDKLIPVMLKRISYRDSPGLNELRIASYFGSAIPRTRVNGCVPVYEVLKVEEVNERTQDAIQVMVMPYLRPFDDPQFDRVGEVMECFRQVIEGLEYLHRRFVAHRNITKRSIMMDHSGLYASDTTFHPIHISKTLDLKHDVHPLCIRTESKLPVRYFIIDFSRAKAYDPRTFDGPPLEPIGDTERVFQLPEYRIGLHKYNPFAVDVYRLGLVMRTHIESYPDEFRRRFEFLEPLLDEMTSRFSWERPPMNEVKLAFGRLIESRLVDQLHAPLSGSGPEKWKRWISNTLSGVNPVAKVILEDPVLNRDSDAGRNKEALDVFYGRARKRGMDMTDIAARWKKIVQDSDVVPEKYEFDEENMRFQY
ncbi:hypothetical protein PM082_022112 [Marasmius tenuissimus]|nr:hypothetical protein PM082_022112 [Marasmius tenuissimus]